MWLSSNSPGTRWRQSPGSDGGAYQKVFVSQVTGHTFGEPAAARRPRELVPVRRRPLGAYRRFQLSFTTSPASSLGVPAVEGRILMWPEITRMKACLNGARRRDEHPAVPITPEEIAAEAVAAVAAGAEALHLHPRDRDGAQSLHAPDVAEAVAAVRRACPGVPVGVTTGLWISNGNIGQRLAAVAGWEALPSAALHPRRSRRADRRRAAAAARRGRDLLAAGGPRRPVGAAHPDRAGGHRHRTVRRADHRQRRPRPACARRLEQSRIGAPMNSHAGRAEPSPYRFRSECFGGRERPSRSGTAAGTS
ncbi:3-keto-5-aminohexanoate cleavage enzyme [Actinoplanes cyaneus]|nr:3-keto-5-aminohexanoate cleavage enzyme [Actinoplanes cyaneus]